jgi:hypothetical protein
MDPDVYSRFRIAAMFRLLAIFTVTAIFAMLTILPAAASMFRKNTAGSEQRDNAY